MSGLGPAACWLAHKRLESWSRMAKERVGAVRGDKSEEKSSSNNSSIDSTSTVSALASTTNSPVFTTASSSDLATPSTSKSNSTSEYSESNEDCNVPREQHKIQPASQGPVHNINTEALRHPLEISGSPIHSHLQHQSKSFPPRLQRQGSQSSQGSLDSAQSRQSSQRGSSPQIRTFAPDGRTTMTSEHGIFHYSRSPSPMRAISLDARSCSPATTIESDMRVASQNSLSSLFAGPSGTHHLNSPKISNRCLSPLLIPPRTPAGIEAAQMNCGPASPLGALQLDLYTRQEGPLYINCPENATSLGRLHLRVKYDSHLCDLAVHLIEAHDLCSFDEGGFHDPYVRLTICPEVDQRKRQTAIYRAETHPVFDQHFKFPISRDQLQGKQLVLQVLDYDRYSHNDVIGELRLHISELDLSKSLEIWGDVIRTKKPPEDRPELLVSLNYLPQAERLTVVIMKAKNLDTVHDPSVKLYLINNGKRVKKKKTGAVKSTDPTSPIWNEAFTFNLASSSIPNSGLELYVLRSGNSEANAIGSCGIGLQESDAGRQHWQDLMHNARKPTAMWHYLR